MAELAIQVGRTGFAVIALHRSPGGPDPMKGNFQRILAWFAIPPTLWLAGGLIAGEARWAPWVIALASPAHDRMLVDDRGYPVAICGRVQGSCRLA